MGHGGQPRDGQGRARGGRARDDAHREARRARPPRRGSPGVRKERHAGVGDEGDRLAALEPLEQLGDARLLARRGAGDAGRPDSEPRRELGGHARVLAEDRVRLGQGALRARRQVFEVSDRRPDDEDLAALSGRGHGAAKIACRGAADGIMPRGGDVAMADPAGAPRRGGFARRDRARGPRGRERQRRRDSGERGAPRDGPRADRAHRRRDARRLPGPRARRLDRPAPSVRGRPAVRLRAPERRGRRGGHGEAHAAAPGSEGRTRPRSSPGRG